MRLVIITCLLSGFLSGCGPGPEIEIDPEWQSIPCDDRDDCVTVYTGDVCNPICLNGAIHRAAFAEYSETRDELEKQCVFGPRPEGEATCGVVGIAECVDDACTFVADDS
jgi:hypothetical protein